MAPPNVLFPDTNVFLQCKALNELPWGDITDADEIVLLIGAPVQDEIDHLKSDGNRRRSRRARETNSMFRLVLASIGESLVIRESSPRVTLRFAPALSPKRDTVATLDLARSDDRLIDEVMNFIQKTPSAQIVSNDTGMYLRCRRHGVPLTAIPETWLLPPERDERDKQIDALKTQVMRLQSTDATLSISLNDEDGRLRDSLSERVTFYPNLSEEELAGLLEGIQERYPKTSALIEPASSGTHLNKSGFEAALQLGRRAPTQEEINRYHLQYDEWIAKAREKLEKLSTLLNAKHRIRKLQICLSNTGARPADQVLLELTVYGDAKLCATAGDDMPDLLQQVANLPATVILPEPPVPPSGGLRLFDMRGAHSGLFGKDWSALRVPDYSHIRPAMFNRDRHEFYRREDDSEPNPTASFTCEEFRHQRAPQAFGVWLIVSAETDNKLRLHVRASARNMSSPVDQYLPVDIQSVPQSTYEVAAKWQVRKGGGAEEDDNS